MMKLRSGYCRWRISGRPGRRNCAW
ncbi:unnamed protein product [Spirodela intermedia]|uniref:Uncharacterized protein n=2 Tax=Spirodela intermedia TaxID=51605 RepID=A0A7I8KTJ2_SPIIN|nr:unnamed protein product [Spirodela intermedia]CAA6663797.1 unnamed protein product [Spirodela intermedia]CAA7400295.1 unnamed protein product [Spirodela intermedia]